MTELEIYGRHTSYNVQKVLWFAEELELDYKSIQAGGKFGTIDTDEFLRMNPLGRIPVLVHGDNHVWESNTIIRYLAHCFSNGSWIASTPYERSLEERWMDWSIDKLEPAFCGVFWGFYRTPERDRDEQSIKNSVADCEQCLRQIDNQLASKQFLIRHEPTVADVAIGVYLHRLFSIELDICFPDNVMNWYKELSKRSGYKRWVMSDFSELFGRSDY